MRHFVPLFASLNNEIRRAAFESEKRGSLPLFGPGRMEGKVQVALLSQLTDEELSRVEAEVNAIVDGCFLGARTLKTKFHKLMIETVSKVTRRPLNKTQEFYEALNSTKRADIIRKIMVLNAPINFYANVKSYIGSLSSRLGSALAILKRRFWTTMIAEQRSEVRKGHAMLSTTDMPNADLVTFFARTTATADDYESMSYLPCNQSFVEKHRTEMIQCLKWNSNASELAGVKCCCDSLINLSRSLMETNTTFQVLVNSLQGITSDFRGSSILAQTLKIFSETPKMLRSKSNKKLSPRSDPRIDCEIRHNGGMKSCNQAFHVSLSNLGPTHTFNGKQLEELVRKGQHQNDALVRHLSQTYEHKPLDLSAERGLKLNMMVMPSLAELSVGIPEALTEMKLLVHDPSSLPNFDADALSLERGNHYRIRVTPVSLEAGDDLASLDPTARGCRLETESLRLFSTYSVGNCLAECLAERAEEKCGCVGWDSWRMNDTTLTCPAEQSVCSRKVYGDQSEECHCPIACSMLTLSLSVTSREIDPVKFCGSSAAQMKWRDLVRQRAEDSMLLAKLETYARHGTLHRGKKILEVETEYCTEMIKNSAYVTMEYGSVFANKIVKTKRVSFASTLGSLGK